MRFARLLITEFQASFHRRYLTVFFSLRPAGKVVGTIYTVDFQKPGLPHAHMLLALAPGIGCIPLQTLTAMVSTGILDPLLHPLAHATVARCMDPAIVSTLVLLVWWMCSAARVFRKPISSRQS